MNFIKTLFSPVYSLTRALVALVLGLAMIIWPGVAVNTVFRILGAVLIVVGGVSIALALKERSQHDNLITVNGIFDIIFGLLLMVFPGFFAGLLMYFLGAVMLIFGVGQIVNLLLARRSVPVPWGLIALPFVIAVLGIIVLCNIFRAQETLFIVFGAALVVYAVTELVSALIMRRAAKAEADGVLEHNAAEALRSSATEAEVVDAEIISEE